MRRTRFMTWFFLILSLAFFLVRDFRYALEAPLANYYAADESKLMENPPRIFRRLFTLDRYVSAEKLRRLAEEAARRGDSKFLAFAAVNLPPKKDVLRFADKAVDTDRDLSWIYFPLVLKAKHPQEWEGTSEVSEQEIEQRLGRLELFDPENAVPHLLRAQLMRERRGKNWPQGSVSEPRYLEALARETEWRSELAKAFASPRYDSYAVRHFHLIRSVLRERGWDHPAVFGTVWGFSAFFPNLSNPRDYTNLLVLKLGADAEAAGRLDEAQRYYWQAAQFADRMRLQSPTLIEELVAIWCQRITYPHLASALKKAGKVEEARHAEYFEKQAGADFPRRFSRLSTLGRSSDYNWLVLLANIFSGLVAVFLPLTLFSTVYVNAKLWIRKEKKGRLYEILTTAENYLPILLFLCSLALYLSYVPFGQNYAHYMTTEEPVETLATFTHQRSYPIWDNYGSLGGLSLQDPFKDYVPYALSGIALLAVAMGFARLRRAPKTAALFPASREEELKRTNIAILLAVVAVAAVVIPLLPPWEASFTFEAVIALLVGGALWTSSRCLRESETAARKSWRAWMTEIAAYLLIAILAVLSGLAATISLDPFVHGHKSDREQLALLLALSPAAAVAVVAAARMRFRKLAMGGFALIALAIGTGITIRELRRPKESLTPPSIAVLPLGHFDILIHIAEGKPEEVLVRQLGERGIDFPPEIFSEVLKEAGASENLLKALRAAKGVSREPWAEISKQEAAKAEMDCRAALKQMPESSVLHFAMGYVLVNEEKPDAAIVEYRQALRLNPKFAGAHKRLGVELIVKGATATGIAEFRQALRLSPGDASDHTILGAALDDLHQMDSAIREYRRAIRLEPDYAWAHFSLGEDLWAKGDRAAAIAEYRAAVKLAPSNAQYGESLANILEERGDLNEAVWVWRDLVRYNADSAEAHKGLAATLAKKGERNEAIKEYREALSLAPGYAGAHNGLGAVLLDIGEPDAAMREFREARWIDPKDEQARNNLGVALERTGDLEGAIKEFQEAVRLNPKNAAAHKNLGAALEKKGDVRGALVQYRVTLSLDPKNSQLRADVQRLAGRVK